MRLATKIDFTKYSGLLALGLVLGLSGLVTGLVLGVHSQSPVLALTANFLYALPVILAAHYWGLEAGLVAGLGAVTLFVPVIASKAGTADFGIMALETLATAFLLVFLAYMGDKARRQRRQRNRYRTLDAMGENFSQELRVDELLQLILNETVPLLGAEGGEIVLRVRSNRWLTMAAAFGLSRAVRTRLPGRPEGKSTLADWVIESNETFVHNDLASDDRYQPDPEDDEIAQVYSVLAAPLRQAGKPFGLLSLFNKQDGGFDQEDADFMEAVAAKSVIAIQNARLYEMADVNLSRRVDELSALNKVIHALVSSLTLDETLAAILNASQEMFPFAIAEVCLWEPENQLMRAITRHGPERYALVSGDTYRLDEGYSGWIARHRERLWIPNVPARLDIRPKVDSPDFPFLSYVGLPLEVGDKLIGTLEMVSYRENAFPEGALDTLESLANQAAVAIQNAQLFEARQRQLEEMEGVQRISQALSSLRDVDQVYALLTEQIAGLMQVELCGVWLYDERREMLQSRAPFYGTSEAWVAAHSVPLSPDNPMWRIWQREGCWFTNDVQGDSTLARAGLGPLAAVSGVHTMMLAALTVGERRLGVIQASDKRDGSPFNQSDARLLSIFVNQAALVVENAQLYTQTDERLRQRVEELTVLSRIGQDLNATLDLEHILNRVLEQAVRATQATHGNVNLVNWQTSTLETRALYGFTPESLSQRVADLATGRGIIGRAASSGEPVVVDDVSRDPDYVAIVPETCSELAMPIVHAGQVVGVINLESPVIGGFTEAHIEFLDALASQAALAVGNAQRYEEQKARGELLRRRAEQLGNLFEISQAMRSDRPLAEVLEEVAYAVQESVGLDQVLISVLEGDRLRRMAAAGLPLAVFQKMQVVRPPWSDVQEIMVPEFRRSNSYYVPYERREARDHLPVYASVQSQTERRSGEWHPHDVLLVPLQGGGGTILGIMSVDQPRDNLIPDRNTIEILEIFAGQAALAIENAQLVQDLERRLHEMAVINEIGRVVSSVMEMDQLLAVLREQIARLMPVENFYVALYDRASDELRFPLFVRRGQEVTIEPVPARRESSPTAYVVKTGQPLLLPAEASQRAMDLLGIEEPKGEPARSWLGVPMTAGDKVVGAMTVQDYETDDTYDDDHLRTLGTIAVQAGIAIENARLYEEIRGFSAELERRVSERTQALARANQELTLERDRVETLYRITVELGVSLDMERVLHRALELLNQTVGADRGSVFVLDLETGRIVHRAVLGEGRKLPRGGVATPFHRGEGLAGAVIQTRQSTIVPDVYQDERWVEPRGQQRRHRSALAVPLIVADEAMGVLMLYHKALNYFTPEHLRLVEAVASQVASAINNAQLYQMITEQANQLGAALKSQQVEAAKSQAILEGVADGVMVADAAGYVILFNAAAERILNTPRDQIVGRRIEEMRGLYGAGGASWSQAMADWIRSPPEPGQATFAAQKLEFEGRVVSVHVSPVTMRTEFLGTVSVFRDITKEVELDLAKSEFVATVSHELRTPLTSIKGYADLLLMEAAGGLNQTQEKFLRTVKNNADRLTALVNDLLDIGRLDSGRMELDVEEVDVASVVDLVIETQRGQANAKSQELSVDVSPDLPPVLSDRNRLIQILTNLVDNAQRYTPVGGGVRLSARYDEDANMVNVAVKDNGIGISEKDLNKIFDRFFRADDPLVQESSGTGLGLAIVRALVQAHGGELCVESEPGEGSTFEFTIPVATDSREQSAIDSRSPRSMLLVDKVDGRASSSDVGRASA